MLDSWASRSSRYTSGAGIKFRNVAGSVMIAANIKATAEKIVVKMNLMRQLMTFVHHSASTCNLMSTR